MKVFTDKKIIDVLLSRSIFGVLPSREALKKELMSGRRLRIYIGADATGPELHIGHSTNFILLEKLRKLGHEVVVLFGDFTALIGDPSGKESARAPLSAEEVEKNLKTWKKQIAPILSFSDKENPAKILKNSVWLKKLNFEDILKLASSFTVGHMLERDMFEKRMKEGRPVYVHEFFYPLMQGYDSVAMNVDIEIGGSDQLFNMLVGRTLQRKYNNKEKFVIATTLLENPKTGKKLMSKSEGNYIALSDTPTEMYGKTMALPDEVIAQVFTDCTHVPLSEIEKIKKELNAGANPVPKNTASYHRDVSVSRVHNKGPWNGINPRDVKMKLAFELTKLYHGEKKAEGAQKAFVSTFQKKDFPSDAREIFIKRGALLKDVLLAEGFVSSKSEFGRLVESRSVSDMNTMSEIDNVECVLESDMDLKIGKKRFLKIKIK